MPILAIKGTLRPIVIKLHNETVAPLQKPAVKEKLLAEGAEPAGNMPEQFGVFIQAETNKWGKVIRAARLKAE